MILTFNFIAPIGLGYLMIFFITHPLINNNRVESNLAYYRNDCICTHREWSDIGLVPFQGCSSKPRIHFWFYSILEHKIPFTFVFGTIDATHFIKISETIIHGILTMSITDLWLQFTHFQHFWMPWKMWMTFQQIPDQVRRIRATIVFEVSLIQSS